MDNLGVAVREYVLALAGLVRDESSPGIVALILIALLITALIRLSIITHRRRRALDWIERIVRLPAHEEEFAATFDETCNKISEGGKSGPRKSVATAWSEYCETLVRDDAEGRPVVHNAVRPSTFFNIEDLHFGSGFSRILPGLFVTAGLFLTFLGLIAALHGMGEDLKEVGEVSSQAMTGLLTVASAKFIMSLTGLLCSIIFTIVLRFSTGRIEGAVHRLNATIEDRLSFISLEEMAVRQLAATIEQREHFRKIGTELVAELGRPLREELPSAISTSISSAMEPLIQQMSKVGSDGVGAMVADLSTRFSDDVGQALGAASTQLGEAADRIGGLVDRMDQSSGQMGSEMERAVSDLSRSLERLRAEMSAGAEATSEAFSLGAERVLGAMNEALQGIRDNTADGAQALSDAARDMREAAVGIRGELEAAARQGADAAQAQLRATGEKINQMTGEMQAKASADLLAPMSDIAGRLAEMVEALRQGATEISKASDGIRAGADASQSAALSFRSSAENLTEAAGPIRSSVESVDSSARRLSDTTGTFAEAMHEMTANATQTLAAAQTALGGQQRAIEATLEQLAVALDRLRGQGDQLDTIDEKLGNAFKTFGEQVSTAVDALFGHVRTMNDELAPALDKMREIVEQAEAFRPQSRQS